MQVTTLRQQLIQFAYVMQRSLFPLLQEEIGPLGAKAELLVQVLSMAPLGPWLGAGNHLGRPREDRCALAAAFLAKAVYNFTTTRQLIEELSGNAQLRRLCGWAQPSELPQQRAYGP